MKILCPTCERMAPVLSFRVDAQDLFLSCARCGSENPVELGSPLSLTPAEPVAEPPPSVAPPAPAPAAAPAPPPVAAPAPPPAPRVVSLRPVTDAVRLAAEAARSADPFAVPPDRCPKCVGERPKDALFCPHCGLAWANYQPEQNALSEELEKAFRHALEQWDEPARHEAVLALATRTGQLPAVGRLYRLRLVAAPTDPVAQRGRDEVLRRAAATSEVMRSGGGELDAPKIARWTVAVLGGVALLTVAVLVFWMTV